MQDELIFTFSGLDGSGKTTQARLLIAALAQQGYRPHFFWTRGGYTPGMELIKKVMKRAGYSRQKHDNLRSDLASPSSSSSTSPKGSSGWKKWLHLAYLSASLLDLWAVYGLYLRWLRRKHGAVVCDRYLYDTLADFRSRFPQYDLEQWALWRLMVASTPRPNHTFLLDIPAEIASQRQDARPEAMEPVHFFAHRMALYRDLAERYTDRVVVLDGQRPVEELHQTILALVQQQAQI